METGAEEIMEAGAEAGTEAGADEGAALGALEGAVMVAALAKPARRTIDAILNCIVCESLSSVESLTEALLERWSADRVGSFCLDGSFSIAKAPFYRPLVAQGRHVVHRCPQCACNIGW
jgi:hypothetical protein